MLPDAAIAQNACPCPINDVASELGLAPAEIEHFGRSKAKVFLSALEDRADKPDAKLILMTAITPTPAGEGKTTTTIGLGDAIRRIGKRVCIALREPSLGPCFGVKGGATGGGYAQVVPMVDINLHFTGDFHAVTSAHNLLAAMLENHLHHGNELNIDIHSIDWRRVIDLSERSLRDIVVGLGGKSNGYPRQSGFDITTASEIMALLCLSSSQADLEERLSRIIVGYTYDRKPVTAEHLQAVGAMTVLLKDALNPNLVQTLEGTPAFVHGGPFGNIAHGCNSILATKLAMKLSDYVVTEAGFATDLGAEKFFDIKCRTGGLKPSACVVVATIRALKLHGGVAFNDLEASNPVAVFKGCENLAKHCENVRLFGLEPIVAVNRFSGDSEEEIGAISKWLDGTGTKWALSDVWARGGEGGEELASLVVEACNKPSDFQPLYDLEDPLKDKMDAIAKKVYGAAGVEYQPSASKRIRELEKLGFGKLPICVAKTQNSLSDNAKAIGRPKGFWVFVRDVKVSAGAGFVVFYAGNIVTMPGLPKAPAAVKMGLDADGRVFGLS